MSEEKTQQSQQMAEPLKLIIQSSCPKCSEPMFIAYNVHCPTIEAILTVDDVKRAKEDMLKKIEGVKFKDDTQKKLAVEWINSENTIIGPNDVDKLIKSIMLSQEQNDNQQQRTSGNKNK